MAAILQHPQDTVFTKALVLTKSISDPHSENVFLPYLPILSVIVGALLAFIAQYLIKRYDQKQQDKREIPVTKNNLLRSVNLLHFYLRDLAYLKVDTNLQNHFADSLVDEKEREKALNEAYSNYKHTSEKEEKIALLYSELFCDTIKYFKLSEKPVPQETVNRFDDLRRDFLALERAPEINANNKEFVSVEIDRLTNAYIMKLANIKVLIDKLP